MRITEPSFFESWEQAEQTQPLARGKDHATSKIAGEQIRQQLAELHAFVLRCVQESPGQTQLELAVKYEQADTRRIGRRLNELEKKGRLRRGEDRHCTISGRLANTWYPAGVYPDGESITEAGGEDSGTCRRP